MSSVPRKGRVDWRDGILRAMSKTEGTSASTEDVSPERYLDGKEIVDPCDYVFGFGRR